MFYLSIWQSRLHRVTCRYPTFPCVDVIRWIVSHIYEKTMTLRNPSGQNLATFLAEDYQCMYHFPELVKLMNSFFYATNIYVNTRDIVKGWVKYPSKFQYKHTHSYKKKSLRKA